MLNLTKAHWPRFLLFPFELYQVPNVDTFMPQTIGHRPFKQMCSRKSCFYTNRIISPETVLCDAQKCFQMNRTSIEKINLNRWSFRQCKAFLFFFLSRSYAAYACTRARVISHDDQVEIYFGLVAPARLPRIFIVNLLHHLWSNNTAGRWSSKIVFDMEFGEHKITICYAFFIYINCWNFNSFSLQILGCWCWLKWDRFQN